MGFGSVIRIIANIVAIKSISKRCQGKTPGRPDLNICGHWKLGCPASSTADDLMFTFFKLDNGASSSIAPTSPQGWPLLSGSGVDSHSTFREVNHRLLVLVAVLDCRWMFLGFANAMCSTSCFDQILVCAHCQQRIMALV